MQVEYGVYENGRKAPGWSLEGDINGEMTLAELLEFTRANLILIADYALREEQEKGFDKKPLVTVDGRLGKPVSQVKPLGNIMFTSRANINDMVLKIYEFIEMRSPVRTGLYKKSNYVFLNGTQVANDMTSLNAWLATNPQVKDKDIIRFVNIQPYARKLERYGITAQRKSIRTRNSQDKRNRSGTGGKVLAPNGAYYLASRAAGRLYKANSKVAFKFIPGSDLGLSAKFKTPGRGIPGQRRTRKPKPSRTYLYPSIFIQVKESGLT